MVFEGWRFPFLAVTERYQLFEPQIYAVIHLIRILWDWVLLYICLHLVDLFLGNVGKHRWIRYGYMWEVETKPWGSISLLFGELVRAPKYSDWVPELTYQQTRGAS